MNKEESISPSEFVTLTRPLLGLPLAKANRTIGSCVLLDFGKLRKVVTPLGKQYRQGEASLLMEVSWRVETSRSVLFGCDTGERRIDNQLNLLVGNRIIEVSVTDSLPELVIELSGNRYVRSFASAERWSSWNLYLPGGGCLFAKANRICIERECGT